MISGSFRLLSFIATLLLMTACGLRYSETTTVPPKAETYHYVKKGETLYAIAKKHQIPLSRLMAINHISDPRQLRIGQKLIIPATFSREGHGASIKRRSFPDAGPLIWPVETPQISSAFGRRFFFHKHEGIDLRAPKGTPIYAAADGIVIFSGRKPHYGNMIMVRHDKGLITRYAHNHQNWVQEGQRVTRGEPLGAIGDTGNATGYHLHFEVIDDGRAVDPEVYLP